MTDAERQRLVNISETYRNLGPTGDVCWLLGLIARLEQQYQDAEEVRLATLARLEAIKDEQAAELALLRRMIARDEITPCACCGVKLSWQFAGDGTNALEVSTGLLHQCPHTMESAPEGTFRAMERRALVAEAEVGRLRGAVANAYEEAAGVADRLAKDDGGCLSMFQIGELSIAGTIRDQIRDRAKGVQL